MNVEAVKNRGERMARYALRLARGRYHDAIALLARRCKPSMPRTLARVLLVGASQLDGGYQAANRKN